MLKNNERRLNSCSVSLHYPLHHQRVVSIHEKHSNRVAKIQNNIATVGQLNLIMSIFRYIFFHSLKSKRLEMVQWVWSVVSLAEAWKMILNEATFQTILSHFTSMLLVKWDHVFLVSWDSQSSHCNGLCLVMLTNANCLI